MKKLLLIALILWGCATEPKDIHGCLDSAALNYDTNATIDNNSCEYYPQVCIYDNNYNRYCRDWAEGTELECMTYCNNVADCGSSFFVIFDYDYDEWTYSNDCSGYCEMVNNNPDATIECHDCDSLMGNCP